MGQPLEQFRSPKAATRETSESRLEALCARYKDAMDNREFATPRFQTTFWRDMFADNPAIVVPECVWREEDITRPMIDVRGNEIDKIMLVPSLPIFQGRNGLVQLGKRYPSLGSCWSVRENTTVEDTHATTGYVKIEAVHDAPNLDTTQEQLLGHINNMKKQGRNYLGQREGTYILFGQALNVLTGKYPDLDTYTRLPGSVGDGRMLFAIRYSGGGLDVSSDLGPRGHYPGQGGRFEEVISA